MKRLGVIALALLVAGSTHAQLRVSGRSSAVPQTKLAVIATGGAMDGQKVIEADATEKYDYAKDTDLVRHCAKTGNQTCQFEEFVWRTFKAIPTTQKVDACLTPVIPGTVLPKPWNETDPCRGWAPILKPDVRQGEAPLVNFTANLTWVLPTETTDGGPLTGGNSLTGVPVFGRPQPIPDLADPLTSLEMMTPGSTAYTYNNVLPVGATVYFRVAACNATGCGALSNEVAATVPQPPPAQPAVPRSPVSVNVYTNEAAIASSPQQPPVSQQRQESMRRARDQNEASGRTQNRPR